MSNTVPIVIDQNILGDLLNMADGSTTIFDQIFGNNRQFLLPDDLRAEMTTANGRKFLEWADAPARLTIPVTVGVLNKG